MFAVRVLETFFAGKDVGEVISSAFQRRFCVDRQHGSTVCVRISFARVDALFLELGAIKVRVWYSSSVVILNQVNGGGSGWKVI